MRHHMYLHALLKNLPMGVFQVTSPNFGAKFLWITTLLITRRYPARDVNVYEIRIPATPGLLASTSREDLSIAIGSWLALEGPGASLWLRRKLKRSLELGAAGRGGLCCVFKNFFMTWRSIIYSSHHIKSLDLEGACLLIVKLQYQIMLVECGGEKRAGCRRSYGREV